MKRLKYYVHRIRCLLMYHKWTDPWKMYRITKKNRAYLDSASKPEKNIPIHKQPEGTLVRFHDPWGYECVAVLGKRESPHVDLNDYTVKSSSSKFADSYVASWLGKRA